MTIQKAIMKLTNDATERLTEPATSTTQRRQGEEEEEEEERGKRESFLPAMLTRQKIESRGQITERERERERETDAISRGGQEGGWPDAKRRDAENTRVILLGKRLES